jgi:hypothetical protein
MEKVNLDELKQEFDTLNNEHKNLYEEGTQLQKQLNELEKLKKIQEIRLKTCEKRMVEIKNIKFTKNIFNEEIVSKFADFHLLCEDELIKIIEGIDKTDYTKYDAQVPRIMDLEKVINFVVKIKTTYPGWKLKKLDNTGGRDSLPPVNWYEYSFITPEGHCFNYGGIKITRC